MDLGSGRGGVDSSDQQQQAHHHHQQQQQQVPPPLSPLPTPISLLMHQASNSFHATTPVPVLQQHQHEVAAPPGKLKLLNTPLQSGNGGGKGDHPVGTDQAREIVRQAAMAVSTTPGELQPKVAVKKGTVRYRECQKNHAASIGGHAIDGCGEFMPGGDDGSVDALRCAACDCHRNFHRQEVEGEVVCDCKKPKPPGTTTLVPFINSNSKLPLPSTPQSAAAATTTTTTTSTLVPPMQLGQMAPLTMAALSAGGGGPTDSDEPDDGPGNSGMMMSIRSPSAIKKRFRTKFTTEQKDQMCAFAEKVGWRIQKHDEGAVQEFCSTVGVKRHVLKVWMHNNKHTMGKKP